MRIRLILVSLSVCCCAAQPAFVLPDDVVPRKYTIDLVIDPSKTTFSGVARIEVELRRETDEIWLNGKDLLAGSVDVDGVAGRAEPVGGEFLDLQLDAPVGPGRFVIRMRYEGKLDEKSVVGRIEKKSVTIGMSSRRSLPSMPAEPFPVSTSRDSRPPGK